MATADRNAEIWSTRLQREILALESSDDESKKMELLPPFIKTLGHTLNIEGGIAKIEFRIDVEVADKEDVAAASIESKEVKGNLAEEKESKDTSDAADTDDVKKDDDPDAAKPETEEAIATAATEPSENKNESESLDLPEEPITDPHVILVLDASMYWKSHDNATDSKSPQFYPFTKPLAVIKSGSNLFSGGSTIGNGDEVDIDLDWTPR